MQIIIVAATSAEQVIGRANELPWHLPNDEAFLRRTIADGWLLTGRRSYESAQGSEIFQDGRRTVVVTRQLDYQAPVAAVVHTVQAGIDVARAQGALRLYVLGGGEVYAAAMEHADQLIITIIHMTFDGDTFFPTIDPNQWQEVWRECHTPDAENAYAHDFVRYNRRHNAG
ncbi:MAG TPA: dihydrofolate reductase [Saprospiraceae bacterium]|nr:dihydrofolate reductase [Saprospiraceae bacterium]HMP12599.1 dihydrofolate reductase [Saprospiraceae bacterium]